MGGKWGKNCQDTQWKNPGRAIYISFLKSKFFLLFFFSSFSHMYHQKSWGKFGDNFFGFLKSAQVFRFRFFFLREKIDSNFFLLSFLGEKKKGASFPQIPHLNSHRVSFIFFLLLLFFGNAYIGVFREKYPYRKRATFVGLSRYFLKKQRLFPILMYV